MYFSLAILSFAQPLKTLILETKLRFHILTFMNHLENAKQLQNLSGLHADANGKFILSSFQHSCVGVATKLETIKSESEFLTKIQEMNLGNDIASDPQLYSELEPLIKLHEPNLSPPYSYDFFFSPRKTTNFFFIRGILLTPYARLALLCKVEHKYKRSIEALLHAHDVSESLEGQGCYHGTNALLTAAICAAESKDYEEAERLQTQAAKEVLILFKYFI